MYEIAREYVKEDKYKLAHAGTDGDVGQHEVGQERAVSVGVSGVGRPSIIDMSGGVSEHPVVHISVLDVHGVVLVLTVGYQHQPQQHGQGHVGGHTDALQPFLGWQHL